MEASEAVEAVLGEPELWVGSENLGESSGVAVAATDCVSEMTLEEVYFYLVNSCDHTLYCSCSSLVGKNMVAIWFSFLMAKNSSYETIFDGDNGTHRQVLDAVASDDRRPLAWSCPRSRSADPEAVKEAAGARMGWGASRRALRGSVVAAMAAVAVCDIPRTRRKDSTEGDDGDA